MEMAAETKVQFAEFLKTEGFEEELAVIYEQAEMSVNSAETTDQLKAVERHHVKSIVDIIARTMAKYVARMVAQRAIQEIKCPTPGCEGLVLADDI